MLRWGIIGTGKIAHQFVKDFTFVSNAELVGVASRSQERAQAFGSQYHIRHIHGSYESLAQNPEIDAVYVATPHSRHFEDVRLCLENGKSVMCEKPITANVKQLEQLQEIAENNKVWLMEAMWTWFMPAVNKAMQWHREGAIGEVRAMSASFGFPAPYLPNERLFNPELAGGSLLDLGIYNLFITNRFMPEKPQQMQAIAHFSNTGIDEQVNVCMTYANGAIATLTSSFSCRLGNEAVISGTKGTIRIPMFWHAKKAILERPGSTEEFTDHLPGKGYNHETQAFSAHVLEKKTGVPYPLSYSLQTMQQMDEIRKQIKLIYPFE